jgi:D-arabinose 1-dehydrogenase-like Zn-dependent alcohol dehydrogenase
MAQRVITAPAGRVAGVAVAGLAALGLSGCSNAHALSLVREACTHVERSLSLYQQSGNAATPSAKQADATAALQQLREALPLAASAAGENAQWQAFSTTLAESSRVPESDLVIALRQQCADVAGGGRGPATPATTLPPPPTNPQPVGRS